MNNKILYSLLPLLVVFSVQSADWQGQWSSTFGKISFIEKQIEIQSAKLIFANYGKTGTIIGVSIKGELVGVFYDSKNNKAGTLLFKQAASNNSFTGEWNYIENPKKLSWNGLKVDDKIPAQINGQDRHRSVEGNWQSNFGLLEMVQDGVFVNAKYSDKGKIFAVYNPANNVLFGLFSNKERYGKLKFSLNDDKNQFNGIWSWENNAWAKQKWTGKKVIKP